MLDDDAIERFARQIVVPGIGAAGQQKLLSSAALVVGNARGCDQAALYLRAAGVRVCTWPLAEPVFDVVVVADASALDDDVRAVVLSSSKPVCWYSLDERGFTSAVDPDSPLPPRREPATLLSSDDPLHDAAACDVASVACAVLLGLPARRSPSHFEA